MMQIEFVELVHDSFDVTLQRQNQLTFAVLKNRELLSKYSSQFPFEFGKEDLGPVA